MINQLYTKTNQTMEACINNFQIQVNNIRTGRASPELLNNIYVEYFGSKVSLRQISNIVVEDYHTLRINMFDNANTSLVHKAILSSNLDLNPVIHGKDIIVPIPGLTEERRQNLIKIIRVSAEKNRIHIRNIRRDANEKIKLYLKNKIIGEDQEYGVQNQIQKITDKYIKKIENILILKEKELMKF
ncbi:ribosome recycling factor [Buchnera aphidicola (Aphis glycines)]|uniref:Ribosome-recycling factor n=1 Tax=Buchnera aphidicola (Aphis glycines) TaxID=1265350 RepID=A0A0M4HV90_9GAMM|nr:ribosome recycling factor [Buchnera aphidicola]ALD15192.1 ribosome recycling factor [Buchnera aphidicola (Aphis glycines)]